MELVHPNGRASQQLRLLPQLVDRDSLGLP